MTIENVEIILQLLSAKEKNLINKFKKCQRLANKLVSAKLQTTTSFS